MASVQGVLPDWLDPCAWTLAPRVGKGRYRVDRYTDPVLSALRSKGDPKTARLIAHIAAGAAQGDPRTPGERVKEFLDVLRAQPYFEIAGFQNQPYTKELRTWAGDVRLPAGTNKAALDRAAAFFVTRFFPLILIYSTSSLLNAYACHNAVQVLSSTELLSKHINRRLAQTLQLVIYVCAPEGFKPEGHALDAIRKIKLMHGGVRFVVGRKAGYSTARFGLPVNGEDLLGMTMGFSALAIADLQKLFLRPKPQQAADYIYLWNLVGRLLAADARLLPRDEDEAFALFDAITRRQQAPSPQGVTMAKALVQFHRAFLGSLVDSVGIGVMRYLAGDRVCDMVGLPPVGPFGNVWALDLIGAVVDWGRGVIGHAKKKVGDLTVTAYDIPPSLAKLWK
jgi:hypothetical protein